MARFTSLGSPWRQYRLFALAGVLCLTATVTIVTALDRQRVDPDLTRISHQRDELAKARHRLETLPPVRPIHWQMRKLRRLAQILPHLGEMEAIEADPDHYPEAVARRIGNFGGVTWKIAVRGSFTSVVELCRMAQPLMPLIVDSIKAGNGSAHAVLFILGARPGYAGTK